MLLSTELGKDPLLRNEFRKPFKEEALISVEPTDRGNLKIDERLYFVCCVLLAYNLLSSLTSLLSKPNIWSMFATSDKESMDKLPNSYRTTSGCRNHCISSPFLLPLLSASTLF
jgi:hypothetical protein